MELVASEWGKSKTFPLPFVTFGATDWLSGVTLALGDIQISKEGGAYENIPLTQLTVVVDHVLITLSDANMQFRYAIVRVKDQDAIKVFQDTGAILTTDLRSWQQALFSLIESHRGSHTGKGEMLFWDPIGGSDLNSGLIKSEPKKTYTYNGAGGIHSLMANNTHAILVGLPNIGGGPTEVNEFFHLDVAYNFFRGPGRDWLFRATHNESCAVLLSAEGCELSGCRVETKQTGSQDAICVKGTAEIPGGFAKLHNIWVDYSRGSGIKLDNVSSCIIGDNFTIQDSAQGGSGHALHLLGDTLQTTRNIIGSGEIFENGNGGGGADGIRVDGEFCNHNFIHGGGGSLLIHDNTGWGIQDVNNAKDTIIVGPTVHIGHNNLGEINIDPSSVAENVQQWAKDSDMQSLIASVDEIPRVPVNVLSATQGALQIQTVKDNGTIEIPQRTAVLIPYDLEKDMTGRDVFFGLRRVESDEEYSIPGGGITPKDITGQITDIGAGQGLITLTSTETNIAKKTYHLGEIQSVLSGGGDPVTEQTVKIEIVAHGINI